MVRVEAPLNTRFPRLNGQSEPKWAENGAVDHARAARTVCLNADRFMKQEDVILEELVYFERH